LEPLWLSEYPGVWMQSTQIPREEIKIGCSTDEKLFQFVYTSVLVDIASIKDIIEQAQANNPRLEIGGQLTVDIETNKVRQILEGKYRDLILLFEKIRRDSRHKNVCLESRKFVEQRSFRSWAVMTLVVTARIDATKKEDKKKQKLLQVEYTSRLKKHEDIDSIMTIARIKNQVLGVGGKLNLYLQDSFVRQTLEGPENAVLDILSKIEKDGRHSDFKVQYKINVQKRSFSCWEARTFDESSGLCMVSLGAA